METMYCPTQPSEWECQYDSKILPTCYWTDVEWDLSELEAWFRTASERTTPQGLGPADNGDLEVDIDESALILQCLPPPQPILAEASRLRLSPESADFAARMRGLHRTTEVDLEEEPE
jgi:hypothetical protein